MPYNSPASLLGLPVTNVPCGFVDGLPVGLSLTGAPPARTTMLRAAEAFQRSTDWHDVAGRPVDGARGGGLVYNRHDPIEGGDRLCPC